MGINYVLLTGFTVPTEITAIGLMIGFWDTNSSHVCLTHVAPLLLARRRTHFRPYLLTCHYQLPAYIAVFLLVCIATNFLGVKYYGEIEFWFACMKVTLLVGLIIFGIVANTGGVNGGKSRPFS